MSDPYENLDPWEGYERLCKDKVELEAENQRLREALERIRDGFHKWHDDGLIMNIVREALPGGSDE